MAGVSAPAPTIPLVFEYQARKYGERALLKDKQGKAWRDHSWREIADAAGKLRAGLMGAGLKPGERLAILADNGPNWVIVDQAALGIGAVVVPLYTTSGAEETRHILADSGTRIAAAQGEDNLKKVLALSSQLPDLQCVVAMHSDGASDAAAVKIRSMESLSAGTAAGVIEGRGEDLATFIYTSGTTGPPKGVMLSHRNLVANCESNLAALALDENDLTLSFLPVAHSFERTAGHYTVMMGGGAIAYAEGLTQIAQNLLEVNPTVVMTVPRLLEVIYNRVQRTVESSPVIRQRLFHAALAVGRRAASYRHCGMRVPLHLAAPMALFRHLVFARIRALFGNRLRYLISGGAPLQVQVFDFLAAAEVPIVEGYGLTEASPVVSCNLHGSTRLGTVGRPIPGVAVKTAPDGELLVSGDNVMKGYFNREDETREAIDAEGWLHTGDIAVIDADGFIRISDRKKEIIVLSGGKNVSPANLENRLVADPYIAQACVIGDRRKHLAALMVPDFEALAQWRKQKGLGLQTAAEAIADGETRRLFQQRLREINRTLSDAEVISDFRLIAEPFSQENGQLTPTLKVRRRVLLQLYRDQIGSMYGD